MNNVALTGRLTRSPEIRYGGQDNSVMIGRFTIAVDDSKETSFINIKCLGKTAEWAERWLNKGNKVEVTGKLKTGHYTNREGKEIYYTEVQAASLGFGETKAEAEARENGNGQQPSDDGFMNIPDGAEDGLPFN